MNMTKNIALVAHDEKKQDLLEWARFNQELSKTVGGHYCQPDAPNSTNQIVLAI